LKIKRLTNLLKESGYGNTNRLGYKPFHTHSRRYQNQKKKIKKKIQNEYEEEENFDWYDENEMGDLGNDNSPTSTEVVDNIYDDEVTYDNYDNYDKSTSNEPFPNFSYPFIQLLTKILMKISPSNYRFFLQSIHNETLKQGMLDVNIGDDVTNNVSFLPERNKNKPTIDKDFRRWNNNYRSETRIGRLLKKVKYNDGSNNNINTIETYVSEYKKIKQLFHFEIVKGKDIRYWYNYNNYEEGGGSLNNSCMRYAEMNYKFNIYVDNSQVCSMLIMKYEKNSDKIIGRSLIWETDKGTYMDRIYTKNNVDKKLFEDYAKKNNWTIYNEEDKYNKLFVVTLNESYKQEKKSIFTKYINLFKKRKNDNPDNNLFPYMDTFKYYYYENGKLTNLIDLRNNSHKYINLDRL